MSIDGTKNIWFAVFLTEFIVIFIINVFTLIVFARGRHLLRRSTYLIMNLTVADLSVGAAAGPGTLWFFKTEKISKHGFGTLYLIITDTCSIASLGNQVFISLERLHAPLYPFRHCLVGKRIYYKIITFSWLGALILACGLQISRINDAAFRYLWIIYVVVTLAILTTSYVTIVSKLVRKPHMQQLGSLMSAERKPKKSLFIVSTASTITLSPFVILNCISISSDRHSWIKFTPYRIVLALYYLNSILNPVI